METAVKMDEVLDPGMAGQSAGAAGQKAVEKSAPVLSDEELELLGTPSAILSGRKLLEKQALEADQKQREKLEKEREEARIRDAKSKQQTSIATKTQYHPCSFCRGFTQQVFADSAQPKVVVSREIVPPSKDGKSKPYLVCHKCEMKLLGYLGRAVSYGREMENLTGDTLGTGNNPESGKM